MTRRRRILSAIVLGCLGGGLIHFVSPAAVPQGKDQPSTVIKIPVDYVSVLFTVTDRKNHYVTNLKQNDFKVYEDEKPQNILIFRSETDLPLKIALLVDASASITGKLKFEQEAAIEFLQSILRKGRDEALLVTFDSGVELSTAPARKSC
ncbi:MAG: VWA domain-containing protein [Acidobacteriia bacterium]|nr:VWA domain-containing protein [Terriglobia bacterium]